MRYAPRKMSVKHLDWMMLIYDTELPADAKLVAAYLNSYMSRARHDVWPSVGHIAQDCSLSKRQVGYMLKLLQEEGWLQKMRQGGVVNNKNTTCTYRLAMPKAVEDRVEGLELGGAQPARGGAQPARGGAQPAHKSEIESEIKDLRESTRAGARTTHPQNNDNSHIEPKVKPKPKPKPKNTRKKPEQIDPMLATLPDAVDPQAWADWVGYKAETKKPMRTQGVITKTANLLASFTPEQQRRMVDYSIVGGYPGLYENQAISNGSTKNEQNDIVTAAIENFSFAEIRRRGTTNPLYRA